MGKAVDIINGTGIPYAYDHFAEGEAPDPPFICYRCPKSHNFSADGKAFFKIDQCEIELYTDTKNPTLEKRLEQALDDAGVFYEKSEVWIDSEKLYEVLYQFQMEGMTNE